jgi:hypothetical protein
VSCVYEGDDQVDLILGGSELESIPGWDGPVIVDRDDPATLLVCHLSSGAVGYPDAVAWLNRVTVAVEETTWGSVKTLFE